MNVHPPTLALAQRDVRAGICPTCPTRTPAADDLEPTVPRECESDCPVFVHLPRIIRIGELVDPMVGRRQHVLRDYIDYVVAAGARSPLVERHADKLIEIIDRVERV